MPKLGLRTSLESPEQVIDCSALYSMLTSTVVLFDRTSGQPLELCTLSAARPKRVGRQPEVMVTSSSPSPLFGEHASGRRTHSIFGAMQLYV